MSNKHKCGQTQAQRDHIIPEKEQESKASLAAASNPDQLRHALTPPLTRDVRVTACDARDAPISSSVPSKASPKITIHHCSLPLLRAVFTGELLSGRESVVRLGSLVVGLFLCAKDPRKAGHTGQKESDYRLRFGDFSGAWMVARLCVTLRLSAWMG